MKGKDDIKDLFSEKLGSYEAKVSPELWGKVAAKVGAASSGGVVAGTSIAVKSAIGITVGTLLILATVLLIQNKEESIQSKQAIQQVKVEEKPQEIPAPSNATSEVSVEPKRENRNNTVNQIEINEDLPEIDVDTTYLSPIQKDHQLMVVVEEEPFLPAPKIPIYPEPDVVDPVSIHENDQILESSAEIDVVFPNVFTPNKDGVNDFLYLKNPEELDPESFSIVILDAENKEVFSSDNVYFQWGGFNEAKGEMLRAGQYVAIIMCNDAKGRKAKPIMRMFSILK